MRNHKYILFVGDHRNPLGLVRSLGKEGLKPIVVLVCEHPYLVNHSKYVDTLHKVSTKEEGLNLIKQLYGNEPNKPFIYTADDELTSYLDMHYDELKDSFFFFNAGEQDRLTEYMNKDVILSLGQEYGCKVLNYEILKHGELPNTLRYPVITKAIDSLRSNWKNDVFICNNETELLDAYKSIVCTNVMVQEYIQKKNEMCLNGVSIDGGKQVWITYYTLCERFSNDSYGHKKGGYLAENKGINSIIEGMLKEIRFSGIFDAEFLVGSDDELYFLEVNFRNAGQSYCSTYAGANLAYIWAKGCLTEKINRDEFTLRQEPFTAMAEYDDFASSVLTGQISVFKWIKEFFKTDCTYYFDKSDPKPFFFAIGGKFLSRMRKIFKI